MKYRKKPVVIDAVQWNGTNDNDVVDFLTAEDVDRDVTIDFNTYGVIEDIVVHTLEGDHQVTKNDFIIKGVKGCLLYTSPSPRDA